MDDARLPFVTLNPNPRRKALGWFFMVLGGIGFVLPFLQGFLFMALGLFVLRDQHLWAANRWTWVEKRWPAAVSKVEALDNSVTARFAGWGAGLRRAIGRS